MTGPITPIIAGNDILLNAAANNKDRRHRLAKFTRWLDERQLPWATSAPSMRMLAVRLKSTIST